MGAVFRFGYVVFLFLLLPLYMRDGFVQIGTSKFLFYRNVSLIALVLFSFYFLLFPGNGLDFPPKASRLTAVDRAILAYGGAALLSWIFCDNRAEALWGFSGWYMGLATQALMLFGYFVVRTRESDGPLWGGEPVLFWIAGAGNTVVSALAVLNRLGKDPLGTFREIEWFDWNRRNLLSTIGNVNWLSGYLVTTLPFLLYLHRRTRGVRRWIVSAMLLVSLAAVCLQGSAGGVVALGAMLLAILAVSRDSLHSLADWLQLPLMITGLFAALSLFSIGILMPAESEIAGILYNRLWILAFLVLLALFLALRGMDRKVSEERGRCLARWSVLLIFAALALAGAAFCVVRRDFIGLLLTSSKTWGSGRLALWRESFLQYRRGSLRELLFGVGPDRFGFWLDKQAWEVYLESGYWRESVIANAHNEFLTALVNLGAVGCCAYGAIFLAAAIRLLRGRAAPERRLFGLLCVTGYFVQSLVLFQTVCNTPLFFAMLAFSEPAEGGGK